MVVFLFWCTTKFWGIVLKVTTITDSTTCMSAMEEVKILMILDLKGVAHFLEFSAI